ncbi:MAG: hypothetical protein AAF206_13940 [Bacteroidota bacterium]
MKKYYIVLILIVLMGSCQLYGQLSKDSEVYQEILLQDSIMFHASFITCDIEQLRQMTTEDIEFYHDQSGMNRSQEAFLNATREGLCKLSYKAWREMIPGTLQMWPLYENGKIYGVLQNGQHQFYAKYPDKEEAFVSSVADYSTLWLKKGEKWLVARVISFNHHDP